MLTNAAGSVRADWAPGTPVLIADHLNLTGTTPLRGARFVDMTDAYSPALRAHARTVRPALAEGVYAQFGGPQYETPAEVRMAATLGADLVGMSTALETIAAREAGLDVLGISLVTNPAAGTTAEPLEHADVLAAGRAASANSAACSPTSSPPGRLTGCHRDQTGRRCGSAPPVCAHRWATGPDEFNTELVARATHGLASVSESSVRFRVRS